MSEEEKYLREVLEYLHRQYLKDAQPYIDRLASIVAMRSPELIIFPTENISLQQFMAQFEGEKE